MQAVLSFWAAYMGAAITAWRGCKATHPELLVAAVLLTAAVGGLVEVL
jgi:hypothetical protein